MTVSLSARMRPSANRGQLFGISFARQNGVYDRQTALTSDVAEHMMDLQIHLRQRFLHVLHRRSSRFHQVNR